jgi:hypothetical protein
MALKLPIAHGIQVTENPIAMGHVRIKANITVWINKTLTWIFIA